MFGDAPVILMDRQDLEDLIEESALCGRAPGIGIEQGSGEVFGHGDGRHCHVVTVCQRGDIHVSAGAGDDDTAVED